ncbi:hypothetical protein BIW11_02106 [Tropilaelaps mercedesae]|uniref:Uncharacterized protein n=1 Tax=Tropilaelaps mercedesae TaxID=418985 RepID=A0A1V9X2Y8_9ACAR|nr:hypothetical protein BIW11_02106 [Tropilaelaps mercedesae]
MTSSRQTGAHVAIEMLRRGSDTRDDSQMLFITERYCIAERPVRSRGQQRPASSPTAQDGFSERRRASSNRYALDVCLPPRIITHSASVGARLNVTGYAGASVAGHRHQQPQPPRPVDASEQDLHSAAPASQRGRDGARSRLRLPLDGRETPSTSHQRQARDRPAAQFTRDGAPARSASSSRATFFGQLPPPCTVTDYERESAQTNGANSATSQSSDWEKMSFVPIVNNRLNVYSDRPARRHSVSVSPSRSHLVVERRCSSLSVSPSRGSKSPYGSLSSSPVSSLISTIFKRKAKQQAQQDVEDADEVLPQIPGIERSRSIDIPRPILKGSSNQALQQLPEDTDSGDSDPDVSPQSEGRSPRLRSVSINEVVEVLRMEDNTTFQTTLTDRPNASLVQLASR